MTDVKGRQYKLVDYFDVWGNAEDGWEVNNLCTVEENIFISDDSTNAELISLLKNINYLGNEATIENVRVEWINETFCELFQTYNEMPLGRLEAM